MRVIAGDCGNVVAKTSKEGDQAEIGARRGLKIGSCADIPDEETIDWRAVCRRAKAFPTPILLELGGNYDPSATSPEKASFVGPADADRQ